MICQLDVVHNLPTKLLQKLLNKKLLLFFVQPCSKSSECQKKWRPQHFWVKLGVGALVTK
jgi:hypothetical protein